MQICDFLELLAFKKSSASINLVEVFVIIEYWEYFAYKTIDVFLIDNLL